MSVFERFEQGEEEVVREYQTVPQDMMIEVIKEILKVCRNEEDIEYYLILFDTI